MTMDFFVSDNGPWYEGTDGERIAVRLSSRDTNGAYAIVESVAAPGCSPPMHIHRNEEEHFLVLGGSYRILIGDRMFVSVLLTPSGGWRQDLGRVEGARERRHRSQNSAETPEPRRDCRVGAGV